MSVLLLMTYLQRVSVLNSQSLFLTTCSLRESHRQSIRPLNLVEADPAGASPTHRSPEMSFLQFPGDHRTFQPPIQSHLGSVLRAWPKDVSSLCVLCLS